MNLVSDDVLLGCSRMLLDPVHKIAHFSVHSRTKIGQIYDCISVNITLLSSNMLYSMCTLGGFNFIFFFGISIGIKRGIIDICKKITFYFLQNVWKCTVFSHLHLKFAKSAIITLKFVFLEKYQYEYQRNAEFYADFEFPFRNAPKKS